MKSENTNVSLNKSSFVDCGESIKLENIKEEINEEESVDDPLTTHQDIGNINVCEDIKKGIKEEENVEVPSFNQQEIGIVIFFHGIERKIVKDLRNIKVILFYKAI